MIGSCVLRPGIRQALHTMGAIGLRHGGAAPYYAKMVTKNPLGKFTKPQKNLIVKLAKVDKKHEIGFFLKLITVICMTLPYL